MHTKTIVFLIIVSISSFGIGVSFNLDTAKQLIYDSSSEKAETINFMNKNEILELIDIEKTNDVSEKRSFLINYMWNDDNLPVEFPDKVQENFQDNSFSEIKNLKQITKLETISEYDVNSISYLFLPENSNNKLVIYHHGHDGDFTKGIDTIEHLLSEKYSVLAFSMPLTGKNNQPIIEHDKFGKIKLMSHNHLSLLKTDDFNPIKLFFEPIVLSINYIDSNFNFESYSMIGISGGGWTTIVYSAIDDRISESFSVAGSYPFFLRSEIRNLGDYEQTDLGLYSQVNYLELYVLGASGNDRFQIQIFNEYDPCCFSGTTYKTFDKLIQEKIEKVGTGTFETYLDKSQTKHIISQKSLELITERLNSNQ